ncbi:hypothetical protein [Metabacillus kandeliae]|nr:hypothetical protein [Metabacillus kandeliae]
MKKKPKPVKKPEKLSKRELLELMGTNKPTLTKRNGVWRSR